MKRIKVIVIIISVIAVLGVSGFFIAVWLDDDMTPPKLPTKSTENLLAITSNGCCFWIEDVKVSLQSNNGDQVEISNNEAVYEHDIFKYDIPDFSDTPLKLVVEFRAFYGDECDFLLPVMEFENISAIKKTGVLLYFQEADDMYLNVIAGDYHASYKMGSEENRWTLTDTPNKVYSN